MERILELAGKKAEKAEVFRVESESAPACFYGGTLSAIEGEHSIATALRVIVNGRLGFSSTTHPDEADGLVARAIASAAYGPEISLDLPSNVKNYGAGEFYDPRVVALDFSDLVHTGEGMVETVREAFPDVNLEVEVTKASRKTTIMNSAGGHVSYEKTMYQAFLNVLLMMPSDRAELEDTCTSTHLSDAPLEMARQAVWRFRHCTRTVPVDTKKMPVVFSSLGFRGLFVPLFYGLNGDLVNRKLSLMAGRFGEQVLDPRVNIRDDPSLPGAPGSCPVDDEGIPVQNRFLFQNGILNSCLHDLHTAGKAGTVSTGNGYKKSSLYTGFSVDAQPNPQPANLVIEPGSVSRDALIAGIREGIIVDDTMGAGQGNNLNGEFSMSVALGYKIENGQIAGRVKDVMVAGNVYEIFKNNLREMSAEIYSEDTLFGRYNVPWIAFDDMPVSAT